LIRAATPCCWLRCSITWGPSNCSWGNSTLPPRTSAAAASAQERREWRAGFITHLSLLARIEKDPGRRVSEGLRLIQATKQGELARVFADADAAAGAGAAGDLGQRTQDIRVQMDRYQLREEELLQKLQASQSATDRESRLRSELAREREKLDRMPADLARTHPRYHELVSEQVVEAERLRLVLRHDEALLVFLVGGQQTFLVVATHKDISPWHCRLVVMCLTRWFVEFAQALILTTTSRRLSLLLKPVACTGNCSLLPRPCWPTKRSGSYCRTGPLKACR